jgi:prevent-host-death family protein
MAVRRMSAKDARANFSELLGLVYYTKEPVMVERKGKPFAVVISPDQYSMVEKELERAWQTVDRVQERNAEKNPEEVFQDVTATVEAVRQELYEESRRSRPRRH